MAMDLEKGRSIGQGQGNHGPENQAAAAAAFQAIRNAAQMLDLPPEPLPALSELAVKAPEPWTGRLHRAGLGPGPSEAGRWPARTRPLIISCGADWR